MHPEGETLVLRADPDSSDPDAMAKMRANQNKFMSKAECEAIFGALHRTVEIF